MKLILKILPLFLFLSASIECCISNVCIDSEGNEQISDVVLDYQSSITCHCYAFCYYDFLLDNQRAVKNDILNYTYASFPPQDGQSRQFLDVLLRPPIS